MTQPIVLSAGVLKLALAGLARVHSRGTLPVLNYVKIVRRDGAIHLTATDLDMWLTYSVATEPPPITDLQRRLSAVRWAREAASVLVPIYTLREAVRATGRDPSASITIGEGALAYPIAGQPASVPFNVIHVEEFPDEVPTASSVQQIHLGPNDRAAIVDAATFASTDETRYVLNGVYLEANPDTPADSPLVADPSVVATDGRRLYQQRMPALAGLGQNLILPNGALRILSSPSLMAYDWQLAHLPEAVHTRPPNEEELAAYEREYAAWQQACAADGGCAELPEPKKPIEIEVSASRPRLVFSAGPWRLSTKLIEGTFPNFREVVPSSLDSHITAAVPPVAHATMIAVLKQVPKTGKETTVSLVFHGTHLEVRGKDGFTAFVPGVTSDAPIGTIFNRDFLLSVVGIGPGYFRLLDNMSPCLYFAGTARTVLMQMRGDVATVPDPAREELEAAWKDCEVLQQGDEGTVTEVIREGVRLLCRVRWSGGSFTNEEPSALERPPVVPAKSRRKKAA